MKKIIYNFILSIFFIFISLVIILSTLGVETDKFNNLISEKVFNTNNINLKLNTVKFKLDYKELRLFLETKNPKIIYKEILLPAQNIKVYVDFLPLFKSNFIIRKISLKLEELDIVAINRFSSIIKPSTF